MSKLKTQSVCNHNTEHIRPRCWFLTSCLALSDDRVSSWEGYTHVQVLQVKSVRAYAHVVMSAVSASALFSMTHSSSICLKFMVIVFFSLLQKDDAGNWWWGGVMDFVDNFLETSFKNTGLKRLIKPLSHNFSAYSYLQDCFIYIFASHGRDQFKNKIGEIFCNC